MYRKKLLCAIICLFMLTSCAGLLIGYDARKAFEQGLGLFNQGKYSEAVPLFQKAAELEPEYTQAYIYLGRSYLNLRQWFEAIPPLRTAYRLSPGETKKEAINFLLDALIGAALSELKQGNFTSSIGYLREALDVEPGSDKAKNELVNTMLAYGGNLLSEGNFSDAITQFTEAIELSPNNLDAYLGLAKAYLNKGDFIDAMRTINNAMKIAPTEKDRSMFQELLKR